ncbi:histidine kinase [Phoenicibacter congonensis]|uniref:sensor histidine kinase n=1 Tax=Phoenicibacter congonensis TaxID=1944646 RepID=UPI0009A86BE9
MDQFNIAFDAYSAFLCLILGGYVLISSDRRDNVNRCFVGICACNLIMAVGDMVAWCFALPLGEVEYALVLIGTFFFYVAPVPLFLFFTGYIVAFISKRHEVTHDYFKLSVVLFAVYLLGCVASLFNGMFFTVDAEHGYMRGRYFLAAQLIPVFLHLRNAAIVVRYRSCLSAKELLGFACYIALPIVAEIIQVLNYGVALMNSFVAIAILLVFLNIQSERKALLEKRERELVEARSDIMLSQIQPHFLYNVLTGIRELCSSDPAEAVVAIGSFSAFLRENMASLTSKSPIPFEKELQHTATYLDLERLRFGERLRVRYDIQSKGFSLPPLSVQALAENAVRHGITVKEDGGEICISTREDEAFYEISIVDDGIGFDPDRDLDPSAHIGIQNVRKRLADISGATLEVRSAPNHGTQVTIRIPRESNKLEGNS